MRLWVIDGAKALRKAIVQTFGARALIQRCQEHYADFRVMPTFGCRPAVNALARSA
jgi:hypothetical protein